MARDRLFGSDVPFCAWMRRQEELPSDGATCGFAATDVDVLVHRFKENADGLGTRAIQAMMLLEVKTRGAPPTDSQRDTLFKHMCCLKNRKAIRNEAGRIEYVRHFGVSFLVLEGTDPEDSAGMQWGRFDLKSDAQRIRWCDVTVPQLLALLRFEIHPDDFKNRNPFRRHHKTREIIETRNDGLFPYEHVVVKRS